MVKKVTLVSSGQPSANPRLVKEATALLDLGYNVTVIYCLLSPWADGYDQQLFLRYPRIKWISVGSHSKKKCFGFYWARLRRKFYEFIFRFIGNFFHASERSLVLFSQELMYEACYLKSDLYIGHNLGALPAVATAADKYKVKGVFDFEDYHRGEHKPDTWEVRCIKLVEDKFVPKLSYATAASPLIARAYLANFPMLSIHIINNVFPLAYRARKLSILPKPTLRLFWFSQYLGKRRGLEQVIQAMGKTGISDIELSLLGNCNTNLKKYFLDEAILNGLKTSQLHFLTPISESEIVKIASEHQIGLALEVPSIESRDYCLTNKIFMYLLAGNAIIFSNTKAQDDFLKVHPGIGSLFRVGQVEQLASIISAYYNDSKYLNLHRQNSFDLGKSLNWDAEKEKFLGLVKSHL